MGKFKDLREQKFGRLTVIKRGSNQGRRVRWLCRCDCGKEHLATSTNLVQGTIQSCGCYHLDIITTHKMTGTPEHKAWIAMKSRCYTKTNIGYPYYGAKGITVCDQWRDSFENFLADMGQKPSRYHSLDRIDPDGDYSPDNCRWATRDTQDNNRSDSHYLTFEGRTQTIAQWAREKGFHKTTLINRLKWGWPVEDALTLPPKRGRVNPNHIKPT